MNSFVISVGAYLPEHTEGTKSLGVRIGKVTVNMGESECKVPLIAPYIGKIEARGSVGRIRNSTR